MSTERTVAVLNIGSTAVFLLIARSSKEGVIVPVNEYVAETNLAGDLYNTGNFSDEAIERTIKAVNEMQSLAMREGAQSLIVSASSLIREAKNRSKFLLKCHQALNIYPNVLSDKEEGIFTFSGATTDLDDNMPAFVIKPGGWTTKIIYGTKNSPATVKSLKLGITKLHSMFPEKESSPFSLFSSSKSKEARDFIEEELTKTTNGETKAWIAENRPVVMACGTLATAYAGMIKKQYIYDRTQINYTESSRKEVMSTYKKISKISSQERLTLPGMDKDRAETTPMGLLLLFTILKHYGIDTFSILTKDMRLGILKRFLSQ